MSLSPVDVEERKNMSGLNTLWLRVFQGLVHWWQTLYEGPLDLPLDE